MTNEELAFDILANNKVLRTQTPPLRGEIRNALIELANKKDQQFKEYLEKRRNKVAEIDTKDYEGWEMYYMADITEIINELFEEEKK